MMFIKNTISHIVAPFEKINGRLPMKFKGALIFTYLLLLVINQLFVPVFIKEVWWMVLVATGGILTFLVFSVTVKSKYFDETIYRWEYFLFIETIGISFIFSAFYFQVLAYLAIGLLFSVALPIMHIIIAQYGADRFVISGARAIVVSYIIFLIASIFFGPPLDKQYSSFLGNPNTMGYFLTVVSSAVLLLIHKCKEKKERLLLYLFLASVVSMCFFTASRTSLISIFVQLCCFALLKYTLAIKNKEPNICIRSIKNIALFVILLFAVYVIFFVLLSPFKIWISGVFDSRDKEVGVNSSSVVSSKIVEANTETDLPSEASDEVIDAHTETDLPSEASDEVIDAHTGTNSISDVFDNIFLYLEKGIKTGQNSEQLHIDIDDFTSGRQGIWKEYLNNLSLLGHAEEEREIISGTRYYAATNAHNVYLQLAYSAGIPAGIAMILLMIVTLKDIVQGIFSVVRNGYAPVDFTFTCLCTAGFIFPSLTSSGYMMFTNLPSTFFWLSLCSLTVRRNLTNA